MANKSRSSFTMDTKLKGIENIINGVPTFKIASDFKCSQSTVRKWKKNEQLIKDFTQINTDVSRKRIRKSENNEVDEALWIWFQQCRAKGIPLSGPLLQVQALNFHEQLEKQTKFVASNGWLSKWKKRYNIRNISLSGEKLSADQTAAEKFKTEFMDLITKEELTADQIFNCDETGLYYKMLPRKTLSAMTESKASGMKGNKERITIMACSNASGSLKLPLMIIGKSVKPRALKHVTNLPVYYKNQRSSWMTSSLFESWFTEEFEPQVIQFLTERNLPLKALLFMDNCRAHPNIIRKNDIKTVFLPPNTTSLIQPMDQGLLKCLKINYRKKLMYSLIDNLNDGGNIFEYLKSINIKDVIFRVALVWDELPALTIAKSWNQLWPREEYKRKSTDTNTKSVGVQTTNNDVINEIQAFHRSLIHLESYQDLTERDSYMATYDMISEIQEFHRSLIQEESYQDITERDVYEWLMNQKEELLTNDEIIDMIRHDTENNCETINSPILPEISNNEAKDAIKRIIQFCDQNGSYSKDVMMTLHRLEYSIICEKR